MKPNEKRRAVLESTRERQIDPTGRFLFEQGVARGRYDTDYLNRFFFRFRFSRILAASDVTTSAALGRRRICSRILNALSKRIAIRPDFLCQNFVNNRDLRTSLGGLRFGERATADHWQ